MTNLNIIHRLSSSLASSQIEIIKAPINQELEIKELLMIVDINSITEMTDYVENSYLSDDDKNALFWKQALSNKSKKVVTWFERGGDVIRLVDFYIFCRQPYYVENLLVRYTGISTLILEPESRLLLSVENTNSGLLANNDFLTIWGQARTV
jgi:hypothetical protein